MQKFLILTISIIVYVSFTYCNPFKDGSIEDHKQLSEDEVKAHKEEEEKGMIHAVNKQGLLDIDIKAAISQSPIYLDLKKERLKERKNESRHSRNIKQLAQIPFGGRIKLEKSKSGNRSKYTISDHPTTSLS